MKKLSIIVSIGLLSQTALISAWNAPWNSSRKTENQPLLRKESKHSYPLTKYWLKQLKTNKVDVKNFLQAVESNNEDFVSNQLPSIPLNVRLAAINIARKKGYTDLANGIAGSMRK